MSEDFDPNGVLWDVTTEYKDGYEHGHTRDLASEGNYITFHYSSARQPISDTFSPITLHMIGEPVNSEGVLIGHFNEQNGELYLLSAYAQHKGIPVELTKTLTEGGVYLATKLLEIWLTSWIGFSMLWNEQYMGRDRGMSIAFDPDKLQVNEEAVALLPKPCGYYEFRRAACGVPEELKIPAQVDNFYMEKYHEMGYSNHGEFNFKPDWHNDPKHNEDK